MDTISGNSTFLRVSHSACLIALALYATFAGSGVHAQLNPYETAYQGVYIEAWPLQAGDYFEVEVLDADKAIQRISEALDLIYEKSPSSAAALDKLKASGYVIIVYDPRFPSKPASLTLGTVLAAFVPDLVVAEYMDTKNYPIVASRYIVKWTTEGFASALVHEIVHGVQHMDGRLRTWSRYDVECEASLYQERALQEFGVDKHSEQVVVHRRTLQLHSCVPFIQYMQRNTPEKMELWKTLNPDVPQLLSIFDTYMLTK